MQSPILILRPEWIRYGSFRHAIYKPLTHVWDATEEVSRESLRIRYCETRLPADFCTCGTYMLFEEDADARNRK